MSDTPPTPPTAPPPPPARPEGNAPPPPPVGANAAPDSERALQVYAVYALLLSGIITAGMAPIVAVILAYVFREGEDALFRSHYENAISVFWQSIVYGLICLVLTFVLIGIAGWFVLAIWLIVRCAKGINLMSKRQPYPSPGSWGF